MPDDKNEMFDFGSQDMVEEETDSGPILKIFRADVLTKNLNEIPMCDLGGLKVLKFRVEAEEDYSADSIFTLCKIPASEVRLFFKLSDINFFGVNSEPFDGDFGHTKYRTRKRENIPTTPDAFNEAITNQKTIKVDSLEGIFLNFTTALAGNKGDYIEGYLIYSKL